MGTVAIAVGDNSTAVSLSLSGSGTAPSLICLSYSESFFYYGNGVEGAGQLEQETDRNGDASTFQYNVLGQQTTENWYTGSDPISADLTETIADAYNSTGLLQSATDQNFPNSTIVTDSYTYDLAGEVTSDTLRHLRSRDRAIRHQWQRLCDHRWTRHGDVH